MSYEFERQHRIPDGEFSNDLEFQRDMNKPETAEARNLPLTGSIKPSYLRIAPKYDSESYCFTMSELRKIGSPYLQESVADFLHVLEMLAYHQTERRREAEEAGRALQERVQAEKELMDD